MEARRWMIVAVLVAVAVPARAETVGEIFKRVADSVVVIRTSESEAPNRPGAMASSESGLGSGVLIDKDRVLTAAHVVQVADTISVQFASGETLSARVIASEPSADLALIQLERAPMNVSMATLGDSDTVAVGDEILVRAELIVACMGAAGRPVRLPPLVRSALAQVSAGIPPRSRHIRI